MRCVSIKTNQQNLCYKYNKFILSKHNYLGKNKNLPRELIYKKEQMNNGTKGYNNWEEFVMFATNKPEIVAKMVCRKMKCNFREDYNQDILGIDFLISHKRENGYGKAFLDFAKNYSKQIGCNGYIILKADPSFTPNRTPHLFYRKNGFGTNNIKLDNKMDNMIKNKKNSTHRDFPSLFMYYPPIPQKQPTLIEKLKNLFSLNKIFT